MPDITMCVNEECKIKLKCFRHEAKPNALYQSYSMFMPTNELSCEHFMAIYGEDNDHTMRQRRV